MRLGQFSEGDAKRIARYVRQNEGRTPALNRRGRRMGGRGRRIELAVADADIAAGGSGSVTIWDGYQLIPVATTEQVTVQHNWMDGGQQISSGKKMIIAQFGKAWRVIAAECEGDAEPASKVGVGPTAPGGSTTYKLYAEVDTTSGTITFYGNDGSGLVELELTGPA